MAESSPSTQPIKTWRLTLREVRHWDLPAIHELYKDKVVMRYWLAPFSKIDTKPLLIPSIMSAGPLPTTP